MTHFQFNEAGITSKINIGSSEYLFIYLLTEITNQMNLIDISIVFINTKVIHLF